MAIAGLGSYSVQTVRSASVYVVILIPTMHRSNQYNIRCTTRDNRGNFITTINIGPISSLAGIAARDHDVFQFCKWKGSRRPKNSLNYSVFDEIWTTSYKMRFSCLWESMDLSNYSPFPPLAKFKKYRAFSPEK